jgi:serine/threonine protein kinase
MDRDLSTLGSSPLSVGSIVIDIRFEEVNCVYTCRKREAMPSPRHQSPSEYVDVLEINEVFEEVEGSFKFTGTLVVYRDGRDLYHTVSKARYSSPSEVKVEHLDNDVLIPVSAYSPLFPPSFTLTPDPLP